MNLPSRLFRVAHQAPIVNNVRGHQASFPDLQLMSCSIVNDDAVYIIADTYARRPAIQAIAEVRSAFQSIGNGRPTQSCKDR